MYIQTDGAAEGEGFHPDFTHQQFGEDEEILGHEKPSIRITYHQPSMHIMFGHSAESSLAAFADKVVDSMRSALPAGDDSWYTEDSAAQRQDAISKTNWTELLHQNAVVLDQYTLAGKPDLVPFAQTACQASSSAASTEAIKILELDLSNKQMQEVCLASLSYVMIVAALTDNLLPRDICDADGGIFSMFVCILCYMAVVESHAVIGNFLHRCSFVCGCCKPEVEASDCPARQHNSRLHHTAPIHPTSAHRPTRHLPLVPTAYLPTIPATRYYAGV